MWSDEDFQLCCGGFNAVIEAMSFLTNSFLIDSIVMNVKGFRKKLNFKRFRSRTFLEIPTVLRMAFNNKSSTKYSGFWD